MRILTFNLWHGLAPQGRVRFRALEPEFRRLQREELQRDLIKEIAADVCCFQEVNPLEVRAAELSRLTATTSVMQPDLVGFKIQGRGWPWNLNSGLLTLVREQWGPRRIESVKLSGAKWSLESNFLALQWAESRYATMTEFLHGDWGRTLVINAHFHHGVELDEELKIKIQSLTDQGHLTPTAATELKDRIQVANRRREQELKTLLSRLEKVRSRYSLVIMAGDFNFTSVSSTYAMLIEQGFRDLWSEKHRSEHEGYTYDGEKNWGNHVFTREFPIPLEFDDLTFSPKTRAVISETIKTHENRRRRIDYVFASSAGRTIKVRSAKLVGVPEPDELGPSDHFGLMVEFE